MDITEINNCNFVIPFSDGCLSDISYPLLPTRSLCQLTIRYRWLTTQSVEFGAENPTLEAAQIKVIHKKYRIIEVICQQSMRFDPIIIVIRSNWHFSSKIRKSKSEMSWRGFSAPNSTDDICSDAFEGRIGRNKVLVAKWHWIPKFWKFSKMFFPFLNVWKWNDF